MYKSRAAHRTMSDFFAQLGSNIRFPDANINGGGPLPTSLSGPAGINGDPDGKINFNSELLSGIAPYAYGQGRMGADRNYQQIPHRIQKIIPKLYLPYADIDNSQSCVGVSHGVDQGDIAFILQSTRVQGQLFDNHAMRDASIANLQIPSHTAFINISTVNYLLAGLQRLTKDTPQTATWAVLARDLGYRYKRGHQRAEMLKLISTRMVPFGICAGSEKQGGLHETGLAPVQAAVNHVTTLTVDGQNRDLVNLWRNVDVSAGDQLIFKLAWLPTHSYTLNHYYKGVVRQTFVKPQSCWQLIPDTFNMGKPETPLGDAPWAYDYRINGYWRIGQCFQHRASFEADVTNIFHDTSFLRGQLLQVTFAPVWNQCQPLNTEDPPVASAGPGLSGNASHAKDGEFPTRHDNTVSGRKRSFFEMFRATEKELEPTHLPQYVENKGPLKLGVPWKFASAIPAPGLRGLQEALEQPLPNQGPGRVQTGATGSVLHTVLNVSNVLGLRGIATHPPPSASAVLATRLGLAGTQTKHTESTGFPVNHESHGLLPKILAPPIVGSRTNLLEPAHPYADAAVTGAVVTGATPAVVASLQSLNAQMIALETQSVPAVIKVQRVSTKPKKNTNNAPPQTQ